MAQDSLAAYQKAYELRRDLEAFRGVVKALLKLGKVDQALLKAKEGLTLMPKVSRATRHCHITDA